jgi:hypothetical protein
VNRLLYKSEHISAFLFDGTLYSTHVVESLHPRKMGTHVNTASNNPNIFTLGLALGDETVLFVAADVPVTGRAMIEHAQGAKWQEVTLKSGEALLFKFPNTPESARERKGVTTSA